MEQKLHTLNSVMEKALKLAALHRQVLETHIVELINSHPLLVPHQKAPGKNEQYPRILSADIQFNMDIHVQHTHEDHTIEELLIDGRFSISGGYQGDLASLSAEELSSFAHQLEKAILGLEVEKEFRG